MKTAHRLPPVLPTAEIAADIYTFSGENDWPEQLASLRSFLRFVGRPRRFIIVSDGSHIAASRGLLKQANSCVDVVDGDGFARSDIPSPVKTYMKAHPLGKKLAALMSIPPSAPAIYSDSDILFFRGAEYLRNLAGTATSWFLEDCSPSLDERLLRRADAERPYVNSGFLVLNSQVDWLAAANPLSAVSDSPNHFTEQTVVHFAMQASGARPLPSSSCILQYDDQFRFADRYANRPGIVLRHYISSIRTKFWHHTELFS